MLLTSHVDDLLWACDQSCDWIIKEIIDEFKCGTVESDSFRYCGKEVRQDEDYNIHITCGDTTRTIKKIPISTSSFVGLDPWGLDPGAWKKPKLSKSEVNLKKVEKIHEKSKPVCEQSNR